MQIYDKLEKQNKPSCIALGCFDGIHIGHQKIIGDMCRYASEHSLSASVFTFPASPAALLGGYPRRALMSQKDKMAVLEKLGVENCYSIDFFKIRNITAEEYVKKILTELLNAKAVFCGYNYRFGKNAGGDCEYLKYLCGEPGIEVYVTSPVCYGEDSVSSSRIRSLIENGEIAAANRLLGKPFSLEQTIVEGLHNGRTVGVPTINQNIPSEFVTPKYGVYASFVCIDGKRYNSITNVGIRPTVNGSRKNVETHILGNYFGELYGKTVRTELLYFVREERKFNSLAELSKQIKRDIDFVNDRSIYRKYSY